MRKRLLMGLIGCMLTFSLIGCGETTTIDVNVENSENLNDTKLGTDVLIKIGNGLWYDSTTRIVYWWNECLGEDEWDAWRMDTTPTAYYAPNGLPYLYNPETNTFEEISNE